MRFWILASAIIGLAGCAGRIQGFYDVPIDNSFETVRSGFVRTPGTITLALSIRESDGFVAACGAFTADGSGIVQRLSRQVMGNTFVRIGDDVVIQGLSFLPAYQTEAELVLGTARCALTSNEWKPAYQFERISLGRTTTTYEV